MLHELILNTAEGQSAEKVEVNISLRSARVGMQTHFNLPRKYTESCATDKVFENALRAGYEAYIKGGPRGTIYAVTVAIMNNFEVEGFKLTTPDGGSVALAIERAFETALLCEVMFGTVSQPVANGILRSLNHGRCA